MKISALILFMVLAAGQAYARLGETLEEIENRVGKLEFSEKNGYLNGTAKEVAGFTRIIFTFYKKELWGLETNRCIQVEYFKGYKNTPLNQRYTVSDAEQLLKRNYPNVEMRSTGLTKDILSPLGISNSSLQIWQGSGEEGGIATLELVNDDSMPKFRLECKSYKIWQETSVRRQRDNKKAYDKL